MQKVLIITYYWPPSGGAGVQRWVKLSGYLLRYGYRPVILTVNPDYASYLHLDPSLEQEVEEGVEVIRTRSWEVLNWYARLFGREKVASAGFSNPGQQGLMQKIITILRSHFFIPDPRRGWNRYALKKAREIIHREGIHTVISTSPPHSTHLIALALRRKPGVRWIADLRDPWTDIYYYHLLGHSWFSRKIDAHYEKNVLLGADLILTVGEELRTLLSGKDRRIDPSKFHLLPNGFDPVDFAGLSQEDQDKVFRICYTGTMSEQYNPGSFFRALKKFITDHPAVSVSLQLAGTFSPSVIRMLEAEGLERNAEILPALPHQESIRLLGKATVLWLVIPQVENAGVILTGKLFEYLASGKPILCQGPVDGEAATIIRRCKAGMCFHWDSTQEMYHYLAMLHNHFTSGNLPVSNREQVGQFSRDHQAGVLAGLLNRLQD